MTKPRMCTAKGPSSFLETTSPSAIDLEGVAERCAASVLEREEIYSAFERIGLSYGPSHRTNERVYVGEGEALARLSLPDGASCGGYVLHPGLLDGALQATLSMSLREDSPSGHGPVVPFALDSLEVYSPIPAHAWAYVRRAPDSTDRVFRADVVVTDDTGTVRARLFGLSSRVIEAPDPAAAVQAVMFEPAWTDAPAPDVAGPQYVRELLVSCAPTTELERSIAVAGDDPRVALRSDQECEAARFTDLAGQLLAAVKDIIASKPAGQVLLQVLVPLSETDPVPAAFAGLLRTARAEDPRIVAQLIEVEPGATPEALAALLAADAAAPDDVHVRHAAGGRQVRALAEVTVPAEVAAPVAAGGVYLITGGAGGLGLIFAEHLATAARDVTVVLTGRSPLSDERRVRLDALSATGATVCHEVCDVTDAAALAALVARIIAEHGTLTGVIHAAGITRDALIVNKTTDELAAVAAPKAAGALALDEATKECALDFFVMFASAAGVLGNPGQADYAAANAFMDGFAVVRERLVAAGQRHGVTLSLDWPLWESGGMQLDAESAEAMRRSLGLVALPTAHGLAAFDAALASGRPQVLVAAGEPARIRRTLLTRSAPRSATAAVEAAAQTVAPADFAARVQDYLRAALAAAIKLPTQRLDPDAPFEDYGIDSVMVVRLTNRLEETFGPLPKTLFFEYLTTRELAGYFLSAHRAVLLDLLGEEASPGAAPPAPAAELTPRRTRRTRRFAAAGGPVAASGDIAVVGVAGRYPGARDLEAFWDTLASGVDSVTEIPTERWDWRRDFDPEKGKPGKTYAKWGGFIEGVDEFDPLFFGISPREAEVLDPQERLFLQCAWATLEDAGYTRAALRRSPSGGVGVYAGVMYEEYQLFGAQLQARGVPVALPGNPSSIANRVSYVLDLHGPSIALDTMCSSSLTAIHLACEALRKGECALAIAGGVNVSVHPNKYLLLSQGSFVSSTGRCESFGVGGDGYVPGEGVGAVLLKPLAAAEADGDHIYAVIKGSAINHGGKTNGYTVPNPSAQADVIAAALAQARIEPRTISYIEAHGTGTSLGDPIEIAGLTRAFAAHTQDTGFCAIGSAKSNIGHLESAAGIAALTKVLLQLKAGKLAPSLHADVLNPNIDFEATPFIVQRTLSEWEAPVIDGVTYPRRAGISSFGAGGSNAHLVVEEYVPKRVAAAAVDRSCSDRVVREERGAAAQEGSRARRLGPARILARRRPGKRRLHAAGRTRGDGGARSVYGRKHRGARREARCARCRCRDPRCPSRAGQGQQGGTRHLRGGRPGRCRGEVAERRALRQAARGLGEGRFRRLGAPLRRPRTPGPHPAAHLPLRAEAVLGGRGPVGHHAGRGRAARVSSATGGRASRERGRHPSGGDRAALARRRTGGADRRPREADGHAALAADPVGPGGTNGRNRRPGDGGEHLLGAQSGASSSGGSR